MVIEIERKFLVIDDAWRNNCPVGIPCIQGYLAEVDNILVRVRLSADQGFLAVKGRHQGFSRMEYEYAIPAADAESLLSYCLKPLIEKMRYEILYAGHCWEIDVFDGPNQGLVVAEIELSDEEEQFLKPPWVGCEVTHDPRYLNVNLARCPYRSWSAPD